MLEQKPGKTIVLPSADQHHHPAVSGKILVQKRLEQVGTRFTPDMILESLLLPGMIKANAAKGLDNLRWLTKSLNLHTADSEGESILAYGKIAGEIQDIGHDISG